MAARREDWRESQPGLDARRLIFIDEARAKTNMTRLRRRAPRGQRLVAKVPHGHWKTTSLIAALGVNGTRCSTAVDGALDADVFDAFVEQVPAPELRPDESVSRTRPPTARSLWVLDAVTLTDAANCFRHCGYPLREDSDRSSAHRFQRLATQPVDGPLA